MEKDKKTKEGLKEALLYLVRAEKPSDIQLFDSLYHNHMQVLMITEEDTPMVFNKTSFMEVINTKLKDGTIQEDSTAHFNHVEVNGDKGHIAITRKVNLIEAQRKLLLSIDFVWEDDRWQITREVIFSQPN